MEIEATVRFKHGYITSFLKENNLNYKKFTEIAGINYAQFTNFLSFKMGFSEKNQQNIVDAILMIDPDADISKLEFDTHRGAVGVITPLKETREIPLHLLIDNENDRCLEYDNECNYDKKIHHKQICKKIGTLCKYLTDREVHVTKMYFGIEHEREFTLEEIGQKFNLSRERMRQIKEMALAKLKHSNVLRCEHLNIPLITNRRSKELSFWENVDNENKKRETINT